MDQEVRETKEALKRARSRDQFEIIAKFAVRPDDLRHSLLDYEPEIVHFSGHGTGNQGLFLENNAGQMQLVSPESLARLFKLFKDKIECVVLNACYSEVQAEAIYQHIDYVVGVNPEIGDRAAIEFVVGFYDALGANRSYEDAYEFGCSAIDLENIPESSTPVLLKRKTSSVASLETTATTKLKKILFLLANPLNTSRLRLDEEVRETQAALERGRRGQEFQILHKWGVRPHDMQSALFKYQPQVVHFSGHTDSDGIVLENDRGEAQLVTTEALANLFKLFQDKIECVFINAIYSWVQAEVVSQYIEYVIAYNGAVQDKAAIEFATRFYQALGDGKTYEQAFNFGYDAIQIAGFSESAMPMLLTKRTYLAKTTAKKTDTKTILILVADPVNTSRLRLDKEIREIDKGLRRTNKRQRFKLEQRWVVRVRDFYLAILDVQPQIIHLKGSGENGIFLESETEQAVFVQADALASMFKLFAEIGIECVILNACYSEVQAQAISQHINYVIGMNQAVGDKAAITFAVEFYEALSSGESIEFAYELGCSVIALENISQSAIPVLKKKKHLNEDLLQIFKGNVDSLEYEREKLLPLRADVQNNYFYTISLTTSQASVSLGLEIEVLISLKPFTVSNNNDYVLQIP